MGDRLLVADAIVAVERLFGAVPPPPGLAALSFGGSNVSARVEWLLREPALDRGVRSFKWIVVAALFALLAADPLHHAAETVLGIFAK